MQSTQLTLLVFAPVFFALPLAACMTVPGDGDATETLAPASDAGADAGTLFLPPVVEGDAAEAPSEPLNLPDAGADALLATASPATEHDAAVAVDGAASGDASVSLPSTSDAAEETDADSGTLGVDGGDALEDAGCTLNLAPGDLVIDELMVESVSGAGDYGEWFEVANVTACALDIRGLHAETPHGAKLTTLDILTDVWVPVGGFFVIGDSTNPGVNHNVPGLVFEWAGGPSDTLRNEGATITLSVQGALVDTVTYPALKLTPGVSYEFPKLVCRLGAGGLRKLGSGIELMVPRLLWDTECSQ